MSLKRTILLNLMLICTIVSWGSIDSLLVELESNQGKSSISTKIERELGQAYFNKQAYDDAISHLKIALKALHDHSEEKMNCLFFIGNSYQRLGQNELALEYYNRAVDSNESNGTEFMLARLYAQIATVNQSLGNYEVAYEIQLKALNLFELRADSSGISRAHYNIATGFFYQNLFKKAEEHYLDAFNFENGKPRGKYACLAGLGSLYGQLKEFEKAEEYNKMALDLARKIDYQMGVAYSLGNMASVKSNQKKYKEARSMLEESIRIKKGIGDKWGMIGGYIGLANNFVKDKKPTLAIKPLNKALSMAEEINAKPRILACYELLSKTYGSFNNDSKALHYLELFVDLNEEVLNEKTLEQMGKSKKKYEFQKKEHEIELLTKENELLGKNKKIDELRNYFFGAVALFLFAVAGFFMWKLKFTSNLNSLLEEKNELLNTMNDEVKDKNKLLEHSNQDLSQFAYVASHDLKEPLRMIHSYTKLLHKKYNDSFDANGKEFMHYITDAVVRMQTLLDDLLDYSRAGSSNDPGERLDVTDVLKMVEANLRHRLIKSNATLYINWESMPVIMGHRTQMLQLLQNLISNGIKFTPAGKEPVVNVDCRKENDQFIFSVADNGIGISAENQEKVFEMFRRLHTKEEFEGTGIGLSTCKRIVNAMNGEIWLKSEEGKGSTFFFSIPCSVKEEVTSL